MSHKNNQCIHCSVESCQHHEQDGVCGLMDVQIAPKECCCNGKADESLCSSVQSAAGNGQAGNLPRGIVSRTRRRGLLWRIQRRGNGA